MSGQCKTCGHDGCVCDENKSHLFCDGCGKIHEDKPDFVMCDCGRVAARMEWATEDQIKKRQDMSETPRTDALANKWNSEESFRGLASIGADILESHETLERELTAVTEQLREAREDRLRNNAQSQRIISELQTVTEQRDKAWETTKEQHAIIEGLMNTQLENVFLTSQRDRLAEALKSIMETSDDIFASDPEISAAMEAADEALQTLNQPQQ